MIGLGLCAVLALGVLMIALGLLLDEDQTAAAGVIVVLAAVCGFGLLGFAEALRAALGVAWALLT